MKSRFVLLLVFSACVRAQSPGAFTALGNMTTARSNHTATLLQDGTVLIAGGDNFSSNPRQNRASTAELYDPASRTFTAVGDMTTGRSGHTATLLPDGRVLIAGGDSNIPEGPTDPPMKSSAELYDPSTGSFTPAGNMATGRAGFNATLLTNGKVLITGGVARFTDCCSVIGDAELYDPSSRTFTATGSYAGSLSNLVGNLEGFVSTSTLLADGTVLFATEPTAQLYDPVTSTFNLRGPMVTGGGLPYLEGRTATLLLNGKVLAAGGEQEDIGRFNSAELYDPATSAFTATGSMTRARDGHTATRLPDGTVLMTGGESQSCSGSGCAFSGSEASAELYDPAMGAFAAAGSMTEPREWHSATVLPSGDVLLNGGESYGGIGIFHGSLATAELYHPVSPVPTPALFSISGDGRGQGAIWHADTGQIASSQTPAAMGEILSMYTSNLFESGAIAPQISVGGAVATILYFGTAPGYPGYYQVNFVLPGGVVAGSAVPVRLTYIGRPSNAVTIGVQ